MSKKTSKHAKHRFRKWVDSYEHVAAWLEKHGDLEQLLEENGGLVKIDNFLPTFVAEGILEMLQGIEDCTWNLTAAADDYTHNNIRHEFLSVKQGPPGLEEVFRIFTLLLPDSLFTFSAAKYCKSGHIVPHDDRAYAQVRMEDGSVQLCSRRIACIYYLTKDWTTADGGQLLDLEAPGEPKQYVPAFNSVIAFTIPRWHEVKPVLGDRPRYSIFGWFLEPGKLYDLNTGQQAPQQQQQQQQVDEHPVDQQQQQQLHRKLKKKTKHGSTACKREQAPLPPAENKKHKKKRRKVEQQQLPGDLLGLGEGLQQQQQQQQHVAAAAAAAGGGQMLQPVEKRKKRKGLAGELAFEQQQQGQAVAVQAEQQQQQEDEEEEDVDGGQQKVVKILGRRLGHFWKHLSHKHSKKHRTRK